jgi:GAF domain-containing protein
MTQASGLTPLETELDALRARRDALRQAAALPGGKLRPTLEAALAELDGAIEALAAAQEEGAAASGEHGEGSASTEQRLLRAAFADAPVPLFLLERDGTVRRANRAAGELLGTGTGYTTGKPFGTFVDLPFRAAVHTQLAAAIRTGGPTQVRCGLLAADGTGEYTLTIALAKPRGEEGRLIVSVAAPALAPARNARPGKGGPRKARGTQAANGPASAAVAAATRRLDLATSVSRLLMGNAPQAEAVTVQRFARLLAQELAAWVIVDIARDQRLARQFVTGPEDERSAELASVVVARGPAGSLPASVYETGNAALIAHVDDTGELGEDPGGVPLLMLLGATSLLSVPVTAGGHRYGVLTLARGAAGGPFSVADEGLLCELGEQLALAIKVNRMVRRHTQTTQVLQASLLPLELPTVPGVEIATFHQAAVASPEMGGDFYDVFRTRSGFGVAIGDVGGRGEDVAAVAAAARHAIRVVGHTASGSGAALRGANEILLAEEFGGRLVTACTAQLAWRGSSLRVTLGCAGHPGPVLVRPDGSTHQMRGGGLPLGIFTDAELGIEELDLATGDVLVFFTDGLADVRNPDGGALGDRLADEISTLAGQPPGQILPRLHELALEFGHGEIRDDITMLALRAAQPPEPAPGGDVTGAGGS